MKCVLKNGPKCGGKIGVIDTRALEKEIVRVRRCPGCDRRLETVEVVTRVVYGGSEAPDLVTKSHVARVRPLTKTHVPGHGLGPEKS